MHDFVREDIAIDAEEAMAGAAFVATAFADAVGNNADDLLLLLLFLLVGCVY